MKNSITLKALTVNALTAALYILLTGATNIFGLSYGAVQLRLSEILVILPALDPIFIPGITVGCFISNIMSVNGAVDMLFGTLATLSAAFFTYLFRKIRFRGIPVLSALPPVIINAAVVGLELTVFAGKFGLLTYLYTALTVGIGEAAVMLISLFLFPQFKKIYSYFK